MPDTLAIDVQGLRKSYGRVHALRGLDLKVRAGEIFGFLGREIRVGGEGSWGTWRPQRKPAEA